MLGYWNDERATREAIDAARWMHTGDLAVLDDEGYVNIVGRIKDMIIRGGENIYPREVEEFLYTHPDVADVQVIGVPSEKYGEEVMAWVKLRQGASSTGDELAAWCKGQIATYKIPRHWKFVDAFPMTVTRYPVRSSVARSTLSQSWRSSRARPTRVAGCAGAPPCDTGTALRARSARNAGTGSGLPFATIGSRASYSIEPRVRRSVGAPTTTSSGSAPACNRATTLTASPVTKNWR